MSANNQEPTIHNLKIKTDERGWFVEILKPEDIDSKYFGQISMTVLKPKQVKGYHYHEKRLEWFCVITGDVEFSLQHIKTKRKKEFILSKNHLRILCVPPLWLHTLKNMGNEEARVILYYNNPFRENNTDTHLLIK